MLFMDWRDSHTRPYPDMKEANQELPTFLYAMPFTKTEIFVEETSLVARPTVNFDDLKDRMYARLKHLGIKVGHLPAGLRWQGSACSKHCVLVDAHASHDVGSSTLLLVPQKQYLHTCRCAYI